MGDDGSFTPPMKPSPSTTCRSGVDCLAAVLDTGPAVVFTQFITRYAFNDSASWTEEIALPADQDRVRRCRDWRSQEQSHSGGPALSLLAAESGAVFDLVDAARIAFSQQWCGSPQMMMKMESYKMTIVDLPMNIVYGVCLFGFVGMMLRSMWVACALAGAACLNALNPRWPTANRQNSPC